MNLLLAIEPQQLIVIGVATVAVVLLLLRLLRSWREPSGATQKSLEGNNFARDSQPPDELVRWEVQMHDTARELKAELDTKMVALQVLIRQADEQCKRLEELLEETRKAKVGTRNEAGGVRSAERGMRSE